MDHNEITMTMDVKLDIHDKRVQALKFRSWASCQVKIEAVKCVPCFLRISFQLNPSPTELEQAEDRVSTGSPVCLTVSINVPGVTLSLATSRTKQFSYGLFWTQNRRNCYIYFALETELACRRHMRWLKKSIKNLELYRQLFLEQRRLSRGPGRLVTAQEPDKNEAPGPLHQQPTLYANDVSMSTSRLSEIYEEICVDNSRLSRASIASGIYEEMRPTTQNFKSIVEEPPALPPLPPLPVQRKRVNTFEHGQQGVAGIPRSNTNPESELAKKKKYKNMLDTIFGTGRQKRAETISKCDQASPMLTLYENAPPAAPLPNPAKLLLNKNNANILKSQRNSFSSPDLSQLNSLSIDDSHVADLYNTSGVSGDNFNLSLDDSSIGQHSLPDMQMSQVQGYLSKADSLESLNVSKQLPHNFNFSACNSSTINLIGAHGAVPQTDLLHKNKILVDDTTGYCVMAPIVKKTETQPEKPVAGTEYTSSGYSTGSYCSSTSSCNIDEHQQQQQQLQQHQQQQQQRQPQNTHKKNESGIYEDMVNNVAENLSNSGFVDHLYENLLAVQAEQQLTQPYSASTSTPTEATELPALPQKSTPKGTTANLLEEDYYQTPRKSIISVDDKVPSYYPNSCDTYRTKRNTCTHSPEQQTTPKQDKLAGLKQLVSIKMRCERKENLYITTPEQQQAKSQPQSRTSKLQCKRQSAAHKIAENVYAVTHAHKKITKKSPTQQATSSSSSNSNNNNNNNDGCYTDEMQEKLDSELRQLVLLQSIDFRFDDGLSAAESSQPSNSNTGSPLAVIVHTPPNTTKADDEYENCYRAAEGATRTLRRFSTMAKNGGGSAKAAAAKALLAAKQISASKHSASPAASSSATTTTANVTTQSSASSTDLHLATGVKKFASLPRFKKIDFSPLKARINNVLQRNNQQQQPPQKQQQQQQQQQKPPEL